MRPSVFCRTLRKVLRQLNLVNRYLTIGIFRVISVWKSRAILTPEGKATMTP